MPYQTAESLQPLLDRLLEGGPAARMALLDHSQERLRRLTHRMLRKYPGVARWEDTNDVFQNVLIRLDKALQEVTPPSPAGFLSLAATHLRWELIDLSRRYNGPSGLNVHYASPPIDQEGVRTAPDQTVEDCDPFGLSVWNEFHSHIESMPVEQRKLFDVLFYQGLPQVEAATVLAVPLRTLRRRWQEARVRLMEDLGDDFPEI